jgi:histidine triad (HIT) family protein
VGPLFQAAQSLERAVEAALDAEGTFIAINNNVSQSVPHMHIHIVPRRKGDGLKGFFWPRRGYDSEEHLRETAGKIRAALV